MLCPCEIFLYFLPIFKKVRFKKKKKDIHCFHFRSCYASVCCNIEFSYRCGDE